MTTSPSIEAWSPFRPSAPDGVTYASPDQRAAPGLGEAPAGVHTDRSADASSTGLTAEPGGFTDFYLAHYRRLVGQLFVFTGDRHDAEEVVQEAFSRAYVRWNRISAYDAPDAWVRRVAFNLASSRRRQAGRAATALLRLGTERPAPQPLADDSIVMTQALRKVSPRYRRALVLYYVADLSVCAIADELSVPEGTVKTWLRRGREQLRVMLGGGQAAMDAVPDPLGRPDR